MKKLWNYILIGITISIGYITTMFSNSRVEDDPTDIYK